MSQLGSTSIRSQRQALVLTTLLLLFSFQLLTEFVEAIYIFGLLGSSIPPEIGMVLLFLSALLLYAFGKRIPPRWVQVFATLTILARAIEIFLSTRGRMIGDGIGVAAFLMYYPIALHLLFRSRPPNVTPSDLTQDRPSTAKKGRVYAYTLGLASVVITLYFAFIAPNVIARWAGVSKFSVFSILLLAWIALVGGGCNSSGMLVGYVEYLTQPESDHPALFVEIKR